VGKATMGTVKTVSLPAPAATPCASDRVPAALLALFLVVWSVLAIAPSYRADWFLENLLVFIAIPTLAWKYRTLRFSDFAYACLFVFFVLHQVGAHYTYAEVPYDRWAEAVTGRRLNDLLGLSRNHYDRFVHFLYGLLATPAAIELLDARAPQSGRWRWWLPWFFMVSHSTIFEILEAVAAVVFGGDLGQAYLGTQGDVWDAHKDSALAALGAVIAIAWCRRGRTTHGRA
jgi:putative membrane protein